MENLESRMKLGYFKRGVKSAKTLFLLSFYMSGMIVMGVSNEIYEFFKQTYDDLYKEFNNGRY